MAGDLATKAILVTGGGRGLGRAIAERLAAEGATLGIVEIDPATCEDAVAAIRGRGGKAHAYVADVTDRAGFMAAAAAFAAVTGRIDAVVNNAMWIHYEPIEAVTEDVLDRMIGIGLKGAVWGTQALLAHMDPARGGDIINLASPVAWRGYAGTSIYSMVKGAIVALTRTLAAELGPRGVRVNAISPGSVPTPGAVAIVPQSEYEARAVRIPLRRLGTEADAASAVAFLLGPEASFIHGEILNIDGGIAATA